MEYVGKRVKKEQQQQPLGQGFIYGSVQSYRPEDCTFTIAYEDGDSEELDLSGVTKHLVVDATEAEQPSKRRRIGCQGKGADNSAIDSVYSGDLVGSYGVSVEFDLNLNEGPDLGEFNCLGDDDRGGISNGVVAPGDKLRGLDLNEGVNVELDEGLDMDKGAKKELIDLNLDVDREIGNSMEERERRCFDLNLQFTEDEVSNLDGCEGGFVAGSERVFVEGDARVREELGDEDKKDISTLNLDEKEDNGMKNCGSEVENGSLVAVSVERKTRGRKRKDASNAGGELATPTPEMAKVRRGRRRKDALDTESELATPEMTEVRRGRRRKDALDTKSDLATPEMMKVELGTGSMKLDLENGEETLVQNGSDSVDCGNGVSDSAPRGLRGRKRRELSDKNTPVPIPGTGLRRSSRRAKIAASLGQEKHFSAATLDGINPQVPSPAVSIVSDEKITDNRKSLQRDILPQKVELPPPSCNLDLGGVPVFDFVSVYAFLRSFSTLLFLSPFELDDFVASVRCNDSTLLFDSIHVSLLRILAKHLQSVSDEGCESASSCLRSLNWDFLDLITWPMFLVEYLLLHSPGYIPGLELRQLKLFQSDYYRLPISAKVKILQHLCDDVIEAEAFRSELNRRISTRDRHTDFEHSMKSESSKKRKGSMDVASTSCITEEEVEEPADWNSDECCLCKMDGNLICCDGCPAAFHSRCVGVVSSLLPEGDWYCPECAIEKDKPWMKVGKSTRGAELLGIDPHGRLYYSSCGYLLVLESSDGEYSFWSYNRDDLPTLIEALKSSPFIYNSIISAICKHWNVVRGVGETRNDLDIESDSRHLGFPGKGQHNNMHPTPLDTSSKNEDFAEKRLGEKFTAATYLSNTEVKNTEHVTAVLETGNHGVETENHLASSEGSADVSQTFIKVDTLNESQLGCSKRCKETPDDFHIPGKFVIAGDRYMRAASVDVAMGKKLNSGSYGNAPDIINSRGMLSQVHSGANYVNCYEFARTASSCYEELTCKSSDKTSEDAPKSVEEFVARQLKAVSTNRFTEFSWSNIQNSNVNPRKEKCGWCYYCRVPEEGRECLCINDNIPSIEKFSCEALGVPSTKSRKNHLVDITCHITCMEDHLQGLLLGPWLNPHYSMLWRKSVLGVPDIASLKTLLLKLESNLHHLALSADWRKPVDSVATMGSSAHIISSIARASSGHGIGRKRAMSSAQEITPSSNAATGLSLLWWRGGSASRKLFNWKVLPRSLASKAARQGGCKKIPGVLYPDNGEHAKRSKYALWRAAVETSRSVEQLALQVRELDANIRWDDIGNTNLSSKMDKESKKSAMTFRKAIVRRKCSEGAMVRYLLDFGKRRYIPDVVVRHGFMLEDSSSGRKRYWLGESHVPLHLLKAFEEKRIARKSNKMPSGKLRESGKVVRKPFKEKGFSYLFSRAERSENYQCGHCHKDILIREAVSCQYCKGFFHKRHVSKSDGSITTECIYTCHKCQGRKLVKVYAKNGKSESKIIENTSKRLKLLHSAKAKKTGKKKPLNSKNKKKAPSVVPLRRSARNAERNAKLCLQNTKVKKRKKRKQAKSGKGKLRKLNHGNKQKKRRPLCSSYWLNGLRLSRRTDDERLVHFRSRKLLMLPGEVTSASYNPKCSLCGELEHVSELNYVACEICGVWFHGDALDLGAEKIERLIGFKCHKCLNKRPPVCPHHFPTERNKVELNSENNDSESTGKDSCGLACLDGTSAGWNSQLNDETKGIILTADEKQSSGFSTEFVPESEHNDKDVAPTEKSLLGNDSPEVGEINGEVLNTVETESTNFNS